MSKLLCVFVNQQIRIGILTWKLATHVFSFLLLATKEDRKETEFKKENCVICLKGFIAEIPPTKVGEKGLLTLIEFSKRRNYTQLEQYLKKA